MRERSFVRPVWLAVLWLGSAPFAHAQSFRSIRPIATPVPKARVDYFAVAEKALAPRYLVSREAVREALESVVAAWNERDLRKLWGSEAFDQSRLPDLLALQVPRDARLRVLAVEAITPLDQITLDDPADETKLRVFTVVSAIARTQLEYNDPEGNFQRLEGVNEYVLLASETRPRP